MNRTTETQAWIAGFDWQHATADARDDEALSRRLVEALRDREAQGKRLTPSAMAQQFGCYIRTLRLARHWTRLRLAEKAGIDPLAVALLEEAALTEDELDRTVVQRLAQAFDILERDLVITPFPQRTPTADDGVGVWLEGVLCDLPAPPPLSRAAQQDGGGLATATRNVVARPVALPEQAVRLPDGRAGQALLVIEPGEATEDSVADIHVRLFNEDDRPVATVTVAVDLDGLPFSSGPTDARGITHISGLPLDALLRQERLVLCLEAATAEEPADAVGEVEHLLASDCRDLDTGDTSPGPFECASLHGSPADPRLAADPDEIGAPSRALAMEECHLSDGDQAAAKAWALRQAILRHRAGTEAAMELRRLATALATDDLT